MKIRLMSLDPKVSEIIESNNQQEDRIDIHSELIAKLTQRIQKLEDENQRKRSQEF